MTGPAAGGGGAPAGKGKDAKGAKVPLFVVV